MGGDESQHHIGGNWGRAEQTAFALNVVFARECKPPNV